MPLYDRALELTKRFYEWERWGRGWLTHEEPVALEPPLVVPNWYVPSSPGADDTQKPHWLKRLSGGAPKPDLQAQARPAAVVKVEGFRWEEFPDEFAVYVPRGVRTPRSMARAWVQGLTVLSKPLAFELVSEGGAITLRLACAPEDSGLVATSLRGVAPSVMLRPARPLRDLWTEGLSQPEASDIAGAEFGLAREFVVPLVAARERGVDPVAALVAPLASLERGEAGVLQVLFAPARAPWAAAIQQAVTTPSGEPFFADAPAMTKLALEKIASPLFAATLRVAVLTAHPERSFAFLRAVLGALASVGSPSHNEFVPLATEDEADLHIDVVRRETHRLGMILSAEELAQIVKLPDEPEGIPGLMLLPSGKRAPVGPENGVVLGENEVEGERHPVALAEEVRLRHVHVVGASGTGKSNLLVSLLLQDIEAGRGVAVLDPHGDLVDDVLARMPEDRVAGTILFDPSDPEAVVGWNVLAAGSEAERQLLASDLVAVFRRLSTSWGDQMTAVLANAILAFLDSPRGGTMLDLRRFLVEPAFRAEYLRSVGDPHLKAFWATEFPLLVGRRPQAPILTRLDTLLRHRLVRDVLAMECGHLDFRALIEDKRVFLARLSQGAIGRENAALLGSLLVSRLHQVALARQDTPLSARTPFFVYIDEFHELATPSMTTLFSGIRKYGVGLTVAHQDLYQLRSALPEVERAVLDNAHTRIVFRVGEEDARRLASGFSGFEADDLTRLRVGEAVARIGGSGDDFNLRTAPLLPLSEEEAEVRRVRVREESRARWAQPRPAYPRPAYTASMETPEPPAHPDGPTSVPHQGVPPPHTSLPDAAPLKPEAPRVRSVPEGPVPEGRGGPEHQYLQSLIRQWAQDRGYKADLEVEIEGGGRVDLVLTRGEGPGAERIACEISVTTGREHELQNVRRCLDAGFAVIYLISMKRRFLAGLGKALDETLSEAERTRVRVAAPEEFLAWLEEQPLAEETIAGYTVRTQRRSAAASSEEEDAERRRERLAGVLSQSLSRLRQEKR